MLSAVLYGYAVAELLWAVDGSEITLSDIKVRNRRRFGFLPNGELRLKTFDDYGSGEALPAAKFWAFSCGADHDDEPYGLGLGHYLYWPVWFKKNGITFWLLFLEKFGQPTAVGKYQSGATDAEKNRLLQALAAIQSSTAIRIPEGMTIDLLEATRSGTADYTALVDRMNASISKVYLGHSAAADETPGKLGGESGANGVREDLVKADADLICGSFNRTVARWLTRYNDGDSVAPPRVWRKTELPDDLKACADKDKTIFDMGYRPTLSYIQQKYQGDYTEIATAAPAPTPTLPAPQFAENAPRFTAEQMQIEHLGDDLLAKLAPPLQDAAIASAIRAATSPEDLEARLAVVLQTADFNEFSEQLARALFAADIMGYAHGG
jgi:phage gp29-like protein